jgi:uncharacterized protein YggT (Ycf19 family)
MAFSDLASFDFFLAAVFLWITPFLAALSIALTALLYCSCAWFRSPDSATDLNRLIAVFTEERTAVFRAVCLAMYLTLFFADLMLGNCFTSSSADSTEQGPAARLSLS